MVNRIESNVEPSKFIIGPNTGGRPNKYKSFTKKDQVFLFSVRYTLANPNYFIFSFPNQQYVPPAFPNMVGENVLILQNSGWTG